MELKLVNKYIIIYCKKLLIVPYGIETPPTHGDILKEYSFNRTLWN